MINNHLQQGNNAAGQKLDHSVAELSFMNRTNAHTSVAPLLDTGNGITRHIPSTHQNWIESCVTYRLRIRAGFL